MAFAITNDAEETKRAGAALAACLQAGDVVLLSGDLGAGKTQFVQGVAAGLGVGTVPVSPTFNLVLTYTGGRLPLHHFDLYRLDDAGQLEDIALREYLEGDGVCFVEWAEKFPGAFGDHLAITIEKLDEDTRELHVSADGERAKELIAAWEGELAGIELAPDLAETSVPCPDETERGCERPRSARSEMPPQADLQANPKSQVAQYVLAFDTANEVVAIAVGVLDASAKTVTPVATREIRAHRASNTQLIPALDALLAENGIARDALACVAVGRGPGSFTGVRIAMATAKGIAQALGLPLIGVSTLDAIAWGAQRAGVRGQLLVVADAMRKEVYPVYYTMSDEGATRLTADTVAKAAAYAEVARAQFVGGDGLAKYRELFAPCGELLPEELWDVTGEGLLAALQAAWSAGDADPMDAQRHNPAFALPVYTRLSDAEENERARLAQPGPKNLVTGVQDDLARPHGAKLETERATMHAASVLATPPDERGLVFQPLDAAHAKDVAQLEAQVMGTDAWSEHLVADDLPRKDRTWWAGFADGVLVGYAGGLVADGELQILKVAVAPAYRRQGIAQELLQRVADDARNLGAATCSLEVRASNADARAFYEALGLAYAGMRPRYYSDGEDAALYRGEIATVVALGGGRSLGQSNFGETSTGRFVPCGTRSVIASEGDAQTPLILAIESSCDETAASVVDGQGTLLSDVVASQIDFHARFGGVVPEIASRKHIEAICGVCTEALETAQVPWRQLSAVAVTYAPGLVGALVVGVAYGKGAAWALDVPFIGVNHLEGHLYANKIGCLPDEPFEPPAVVSLVSGGNTMLVHMRGWGDYETLGSTIDDAVGEAFDKVAKALGLGYPGGPVISKLAAQGNPDAIPFPRALLHSHDLRFSLSGLKTAVVNYINGERAAGRELDMPDIAASFQQAVIDVQVAKARTALRQTQAPTFCLGGGVAANPALRAAYERMCAEEGVRLLMPPLKSCGDNAGMIALVALDRYRQGRFFALSADAYAHASLDEPY